MTDEDLTQNPADAEVSGPTQLQRLFAEYGEGRINAAIEDGKLVVDDQGNVTSIDPDFEQALLAPQDDAEQPPTLTKDDGSLSDPEAPSERLDASLDESELPEPSANGEVRHLNFKRGVDLTR